MGLESFFIKILPLDSVQTCMEDIGCQGVMTKDRVLALKWNKIITRYGKIVQTISEKEGYFKYVINDCVDFYLEKSIGGGYYINLIGCFSCYDKSLSEIVDLLQIIALQVGDRIQVYICGEFVCFDSTNIEIIKNKIISRYRNKYQEFKKIFSKEKLCSPSNFHYTCILCDSYFAKKMILCWKRVSMAFKKLFR